MPDYPTIRSAFEVYQSDSSQPVVATKIDKGVPFNDRTDLQITYSGSGKYSGFQVSRDPGNSLIWIASALFLLGLVIVFYFPRRQVLALLEPVPAATAKLYLCSGAGRKIGIASELQKLAEDLKAS